MTDSTNGTPSLGCALLKAMNRYRMLRAAGQDHDTACLGIEKVLRAHLGEVQDEVASRAPCARCQDTGWEPCPICYAHLDARGELKYARPPVKYCACTKGQLMKESRNDESTSKPSTGRFRHLSDPQR